MTDSASTVSLAPLVEALAPIAVSVAGVVISAAVAWLAKKAGALLHVKIEQSALDKITAAAQSEAGAMIAAEEGNLAGAAIKIDDARVRDAASRIVNAMPKVLTAAGVTPTTVARIVAGEVGKFQASMTATTPTAGAAPNPS